MAKTSKTNKTSILTPRKTASFFFISLAANIVAALIIWPLLDLFFNNVITHSTFSYSVVNHVLWPAFVMTVFTIIEFVFFVKKDGK